MAYFDCIVGGSGKSEKGNTLVVTCADDLAGATITCTNGTKTYRKTCPSTAPYEVTFYGLEAGTWTVSTTVSGSTYTTTVVVADIEAELGGFNWKTWVDLSQNYNSSDFTDLDDLLSDETAVRELMTIHACVDYLAGIAAESADVETIIGNDLCAKWINLRDYALDTLYANAVIKDYMDTADKYFYGEWTLMPQVPKMTANNAPYGEASASSSYSSSYLPWQAFDDNDSTWWADGYTTLGGYITYQFVNAICPVEIAWRSDNVKAIEVRGSNDGFSTYDVLGTCDNNNSVALNHFAINSGKETYTSIRCVVTERMTNASANDRNMMRTIQFYAWQPKGNVPVMTSATTPYGGVDASGTYSSYSPYKAFNGTCDNNTDCWYVVSGTGWLRCRLVNPICPKKVFVQNRNEGLGGVRAIKDFVIEGSNDGTNWVSLGSYTNTKQGKAEVSWYDITCNDYYIYLQLRFTTSYGNGETAIGRLQFYGRELSVSVPIMTSNTAPYGVASLSAPENSTLPAFKAFDGSDTTATYLATAASSGAIRYDFKKPVNVRMIKWYLDTTATYTLQVSYSDDGVTYTDVGNQFTYNGGVKYYESGNYGAHRYWGITRSISTAVPEVICQTAQFYGLDYSEREFEVGATKKWLYDHGVELETATAKVQGNGVARKDSSELYVGVSAASQKGDFAFPSIDLTSYNLLRAKNGDKCYHSGGSFAGYELNLYSTDDPTYSTTPVSQRTVVPSEGCLPNNLGLDVSSLNTTYYIHIISRNNTATDTHYGNVKELWLE